MSENKDRDLIYTCTMTKKAFVLAMLPVIVSCWLLYQGNLAAQKFHHTDPTRWVFILVPVILGLTILGVTCMAIYQNVIKQVVLSSSNVTFHDGREKFVASLSRLAHSSPSSRGLFKVLLISDGVHFGQVVDVFMPDFDDLVANLEKKRRVKASSSLHGGTKFKL